MVAVNNNITVRDVKNLGNGEFSVRLEIVASETSLSRTENVSADSHDAAVEIAKESFARWIKKVAEVTVKMMPARMRN